jgi:hypothetical protein
MLRELVKNPLLGGVPDRAGWVQNLRNTYFSLKPIFEID